MSSIKLRVLVSILAYTPFIILAQSNKQNIHSITERAYEAIDHFGEIRKGKVKPNDNNQSTYNTEGLLIQSKWFDSNLELSSKATFHYVNNQLIERYTFDQSDKLEYKSTYLYDEHNRLICQNFYGNNGTLQGKWTTTYHKNKRIETWYNSVGEIIHLDTYYLDDNENTLRYTLKNYAIIEMKEVNYSYNENNKKIGDKSTHKFDLGTGEYINVVFTTYNYDKYGNCIERLEHNERKPLIKTSYTNQYEYDEYGNWIHCVEFKNHFPLCVKERTIEYY